MGKPKFTEEFKKEAIGQIIEQGYPVVEVSRRLGVSTHSLYAWMKKDSRSAEKKHSEKSWEDLEKENLRLKKENSRLKQERDILKKAAAYFANPPE